MALQLTEAMRRATADRVQTEMLNKGPRWYTELASGQEVLTAKAISRQNLSDLRKKLAPLAQFEVEFLGSFLQEKLYITHATRLHADIERPDGSVSLFSRQKLTERGVDFDRDNTEQKDILMHASDDNVFLSLEAGAVPQKQQSRFGDRLLRFDFDQPRVQQTATLHLVDPLSAIPPPIEGRFAAIDDHEDPEEAADVIQALDDRSYVPADALFHAKDMKAGLALSIISTCRAHMPQAMAEKLLTTSSANELINGLFRPTIMVPRHFFDEPLDDIRIVRG